MRDSGHIGIQSMTNPSNDAPIGKTMKRPNEKTV